MIETYIGWMPTRCTVFALLVAFFMVVIAGYLHVIAEYLPKALFNLLIQHGEEFEDSHGRGGLNGWSTEL